MLNGVDWSGGGAWLWASRTQIHWMSPPSTPETLPPLQTDRARQRSPRTSLAASAQREGDERRESSGDDDRDRRRARETERARDQRRDDGNDRVGGVPDADDHDRDEHRGDREVDPEPLRILD